MNTRNTAGRAFALLVLGAACIGFAPLLVRVSDVGPIASACWRMLLAAPLLWIVVALAGRQRAAAVPAAAAAPASAAAAAAVAPGTFRRLAWLSGLFFACDLGVWHFSITFTSVANATLLANCAPILVTLYAFLVHRQRPSSGFLLALVLAMIGASVLVGPNFRGSGRALAGDALGLLASCFYTAYMIAINRAQATGSMLRLIAISTTITAILLLPAAWLFSQAQGHAFWPASAQGWSVVIALAVITQVLGQGCIAYGLTHLPVALSATTLLLQPLVAAVAAWLLLGESLGAAQIAGGALLLAAIRMARRSTRP